MNGFPTETLGNDKCGETFGNDSFSLCHPERSEGSYVRERFLVLRTRNDNFGVIPEGSSRPVQYPVSILDWIVDKKVGT